MPQDESRNTILPGTLGDLDDLPETYSPSTLPHVAKEEQSITPNLTANSSTKPREIFWKDANPSDKYIRSHKFKQAGEGWIGFENCPGLRMVFIRVGKAMARQKSQFRKTAHVNLLNLLEAFHSKGITYLIYDFDRSDVPLSMVRASPNVQFTEPDIAIVCRQVLMGLQYIHEELKISHGAISLPNLLLAQSGLVKIANIGESMFQETTLKEKRTDLKSLALVVIHLSNPHTILEDPRMHLNNPQNVSHEARDFIEMTASAPYRELFHASVQTS